MGGISTDMTVEASDLHPARCRSTYEVDRQVLSIGSEGRRCLVCQGRGDDRCHQGTQHGSASDKVGHDDRLVSGRLTSLRTLGTVGDAEFMIETIIQDMSPPLRSQGGPPHTSPDDAQEGRGPTKGAQDESWITLARCRKTCLLYTSPSPRDRQKSRMPSSA